MKHTTGYGVNAFLGYDRPVDVMTHLMIGSERLATMRDLAVRAVFILTRLRFADAIEFIREHVLARLEVYAPLPSIALHPTCSSTHLGTNEKVTAIATAISPDVNLPIDWGCCGFAGDRGLLHPELTAPATAAETAEINGREFAAYASTNRTRELGMAGATGREYQHLIELLEQPTLVGLGLGVGASVEVGNVVEHAERYCNEPGNPRNGHLGRLPAPPLARNPERGDLPSSMCSGKAR